MTPIGYVQNSIESPRDTGWGEVESAIIIDEDLTPALEGLSDFSHLVVVFWMHGAKPPSVLRRRPQGREDLPEVGLLAQRSKHRPNAIGVTAVELKGVKDNGITVKGLDAINGTPVLDVKPYYPQYDCREGASVPGWVNELMKDYF